MPWHQKLCSGDCGTPRRQTTLANHVENQTALDKLGRKGPTHRCFLVPLCPCETASSLTFCVLPHFPSVPHDSSCHMTPALEQPQSHIFTGLNCAKGRFNIHSSKAPPAASDPVQKLERYQDYPLSLYTPGIFPVSIKTRWWGGLHNPPQQGELQALQLETSGWNEKKKADMHARHFSAVQVCSLLQLSTITETETS